MYKKVTEVTDLHNRTNGQQSSVYTYLQVISLVGKVTHCSISILDLAIFGCTEFIISQHAPWSIYAL
jgi:hypothetical protein